MLSPPWLVAYPPMADPTRFLVVGMQRSGTTVTLAELHRHPAVAVAADEIHTAFFAPGAAREAQFLGVFDRVAGRRDGVAAVGIKTALPSAAHGERLARCLADQGRSLAVILVERNDLVAQLASLRRAAGSGTWHRPAGAVASDSGNRVAITAAELTDYVAECRAALAPLHDALRGRRALHLDYERDIATGRASAMVTAFLGLPPIPTDEPALGKVSPPAAESVVDYAALCELADRLAAAPAPPPAIPAPSPSRLFLLHLCAWHRQQGETAAAIDAALAALDAPADWGVETHEWACRALADLLFAAGDRRLAAKVGSELAQRCAGDPHVDQLRLAIADHLGAGSD